MKRIKIFACLLVVASLTSCDDFLSEVPDNRTQIETPEAIGELLVNAYPGAGYFEFAEGMSDNVFDSGNLPSTTPTNTQNFHWQVVEAVDGDTPTFFWDACYNAIAQANQALKSIEELSGKNKEDDKQLQAFKGEALMARAYAHFMLVQFWAKAYNPETAATDLGIPYVLQPEQQLLVNYKRNTVAEVFAYLEADIEEGLRLVKTGAKQPKFHFNPEAAKAFASRFYLIKGDWDKVLSVTESFSVQPVGKLRDINAFNALGIYERMADYAKVEHQTNLLVATQYSTWGGRKVSSNRFGLTGADQGDILGNSTNLLNINKGWNYQGVSGNGSITTFIPKFDEYFKVTNPNAGIGLPYVTYVLLSNEEAFLNRIEAHVMTNQFDVALKELEYLMGTRTDGYTASDKLTFAKIRTMYPAAASLKEMTPFYSLSADQASFVNAVAEMRRREFLHEGLRWLDIKRFNLEVERYALNETTPYDVLKKDDNRRVVQIPLHVSDRGIEKNPR